MKIRLDELLVKKGFSETKSRAKQMILEGLVIYENEIQAKPGRPIPEDAHLEVKKTDQFVSRGAYKLQAAIETFKIDPKDKIVADIGASTGGFTDFLLQKGAKKIYAIDVGHGQLAKRLKENPKVINMEGINIRELDTLPEKTDFAVVDLSYISLTLCLNNIAALTNGPIIALLKPQFEAGKDRVPKDGVIKDPQIIKEVKENIQKWCHQNHFQIEKIIPSPIQGKQGNQEFLMMVKYSPSTGK